MKKFLITLCAICISVFAFAQTETINWYIDGEIYQTTTCESGDSIILPDAPTKYGYTFKKWYNSFVGTIVTTSTGSSSASIMVTHGGVQQNINYRQAANTPVYVDDLLKIWYPYPWAVQNISSYTIKIGSTILKPNEQIRWDWSTAVNYEVLIVE